MNAPKDVPFKFWDYLRRGLYALRSEIGESGDGVYNQDWMFVLEDDGSGNIELVYELDSDGNPFLVTEEIT